MTQVKALLWLGYQRYLLTFGYAQLVPKFLWRSVRLGVGVVGELFALLDRLEEFFGRGSGDGKRETVMQHGLFQEYGKSLGKGQSQVVEEFGSLSLELFIYSDICNHGTHTSKYTTKSSKCKAFVVYML